MRPNRATILLVTVSVDNDALPGSYTGSANVQVQMASANANTNADANTNANSRVPLPPGSGRLTFNLTVTARPSDGGPGEERGDLVLSQGTCFDKVSGSVGGLVGGWVGGLEWLSACVDACLRIHHPNIPPPHSELGLFSVRLARHLRSLR